MDHSEHRSRRNNFIFYGLTDTTRTERFSGWEGIIIRHCSETLKLGTNPTNIELPHRLMRFSEDRIRAIILKFQSCKTKELILSNRRKLKHADFRVGEDVSLTVRHARKHLITFAVTKLTAVTLRFKTLFLGTKRYIFDGSSPLAKE